MTPTCLLVEGDCLAALKATRRQVQLAIGSPPYVGKGERYDGGRRKWDAEAWTWWMESIIRASLEISPVALFIVNDPVLKGRYIPAVSLLEAHCWRSGLVAERPLIWTKNALTNRLDWWSNNYERIIAFKREAGSVPTFNWEAIAAPPKHKNGGDFHQRNSKGERRKGNAYPQTKLARPKDLLRATVGGGHLGHELAHHNEAPYPEKLVEPIVLALTSPGDTVLDPFGGSGTTAAVALKHGRNAIAIDVRGSQIDLAYRRILDETGVVSTRRRWPAAA